MDANQTRYHLFSTFEDWASCIDAAVPLLTHWDSEHNELTLAPRVFQFNASSYDRKPRLTDRRGAGRDRFGNTYWIDVTQRKIMVNSAGSGRTTPFWSTDQLPTPPTVFGAFNPKDTPPPTAGFELRGLAVTSDHYLVVGVLAPAGLLIFDLHAGGAPEQLVFPAGIPFAPFDMSPAPEGGVWVLDRDNLCYWAFDRYFNVIANDQETEVLQPDAPETFQPLSGGEIRRGERRFPLGVSFEDAAPLDLGFPVAIEGLPDGTVLIMNSPPTSRFSQIYRFRLKDRIGEPTSTDIMLNQVQPEQQAAFRLLGHDFAFLPAAKEQEIGTLFVVGEDGNQAFAFAVLEGESGLVLQPLSDYYPMRLFGGKGLIASGGEVFYDFGERWLMLVEQRRPRYVTYGELFTPTLDGKAPDCVWHRLMLDACIPPECEVRVWSRAADEVAALQYTEWQPEPRPYRRQDGSELPYVDSTYDTWELLFQRSRGRYLQLRLRLTGDGRHTPALRAMRVYYPRFSYLQYLPAVYREEREAALFLERFLANMEGFFTAIEDKIAAVQLLFDVRSTPREALDWLAGWFGIAFDAGWDEGRRRLFIKHAMTFFGRRGTIPGLLMALRLVLDECPDDSIFDLTRNDRKGSGIRIIERFRTRKTPGVVLGDPSENTGLRLVSRVGRWTPKQGRSVLQQRYDKYLEAAKQTPTRYTLTAPDNPALWTAFSFETLGFVPTATPQLRLWRDFLARRYRLISVFNEVYGTGWTDFAAVPYPSVLPTDGAPLYDWFQFESLLLPMHTTAHRFTVLLPVPSGLENNLAAQQERLALAQRVVGLEKPAHTVFEVKFYWAMFRVGEIRLGYDTIIDRSSREKLLSPLILGQSHVMETYLAPSHPQNVRDRQVLGRDALTGDAQ